VTAPLVQINMEVRSGRVVVQ